MGSKKEKADFITGDKLAKKGHTIKHNKIFIEIKEGDKLEDLKIPGMFLPNLKTEGVI